MNKYTGGINIARNTSLHKAKKAKNDEYFTRLEDIEKELKHYVAHFRDKIVYCNCDDPAQSNFWRYFHFNFAILGLKKLIATYYNPQNSTYKFEYIGGNDNNIHAGVQTKLSQNGDFRSPECVEILKTCDIVITNPPFSLFREYVAQLMEYGKKFVIVGNMNAITYKEIFPLLKDNEVWVGYNKPKEFAMPDGTFKKFGNVMWYTNIDHSRRHLPLLLAGSYKKNPEFWPTYDNYDAIEVSRVNNIPCDYEGVMGVPITFMTKYNSEQFEILGLLPSSTDEQAGIPNLRRYNDFLEMRQDLSYTGLKGGKANGFPVLQGKSVKGNFLYNEKTGEYVHSVYARILIRKRRNA